MINNDRIHNPDNYDSDGVHRAGQTSAVFTEIAFNTAQDNAEQARQEEWETFNNRPLPQKLAIMAKRLLELAGERVKDGLASMSTRKKLAIAAIPAAGLAIWGNTPHEVASNVAYIEVGDGGVRTTCSAVEQLALQNNLDPNRGDNCVYAGQQAGRELTDSHPKRSIQPGEPISVTILQSPFNKLTGNFAIEAHKAA